MCDLDEKERKIYDDFVTLIEQTYKKHTAASNKEHEERTFFVWCDIDCPLTMMRYIRSTLHATFSGISYELVGDCELNCFIGENNIIVRGDGGVVSESDESEESEDESEEDVEESEEESE
jgi:hypothetical protein